MKISRVFSCSVAILKSHLSIKYIYNSHSPDIGEIPNPTLNAHKVQGGQDSLDALSCRSFSAKDPLIAGLFAENDL